MVHILVFVLQLILLIVLLIIIVLFTLWSIGNFKNKVPFVTASNAVLKDIEKALEVKDARNKLIHRKGGWLKTKERDQGDPKEKISLIILKHQP